MLPRRSPPPKASARGRAGVGRDADGGITFYIRRPRAATRGAAWLRAGRQLATARGPRSGPGRVACGRPQGDDGGPARPRPRASRTRARPTVGRPGPPAGGAPAPAGGAGSRGQGPTGQGARRPWASGAGPTAHAGPTPPLGGLGTSAARPVGRWAARRSMPPGGGGAGRAGGGAPAPRGAPRPWPARAAAPRARASRRWPQAAAQRSPGGDHAPCGGAAAALPTVAAPGAGQLAGRVAGPGGGEPQAPPGPRAAAARWPARPPRGARRGGGMAAPPRAAARWGPRVLAGRRRGRARAGQQPWRACAPPHRRVLRPACGRAPPLVPPDLGTRDSRPR
jgi:hypothetical protein